MDDHTMSTRDPDRIIGYMSNAELQARQAGWYPTREAHVLFKESTGVCRALRAGETYNDDLDTFMSRPLRHAKNWAQALDIDEGVFAEDDEENFR